MHGEGKDTLADPGVAVEGRSLNQIFTLVTISHFFTNIHVFSPTPWLAPVCVWCPCMRGQ